MTAEERDPFQTGEHLRVYLWAVNDRRPDVDYVVTTAEAPGRKGQPFVEVAGSTGEPSDAIWPAAFFFRPEFALSDA